MSVFRRKGRRTRGGWSLTRQPALTRPSWDTAYSVYWEAPESRGQRLLGGQRRLGGARWSERLERYVYPPAALPDVSEA